jgi:predicted HTH domain antitoxin
MSSQGESDHRIEVDLPAAAFAHVPLDREAIAQQLRALWLVELVRERRLGYGKAAELAQMPKAAFVRLMAQHGVGAVDLDPDELRAELEAAREIGR